MPRHAGVVASPFFLSSSLSHGQATAESYWDLDTFTRYIPFSLLPFPSILLPSSFAPSPSPSLSSILSYVFHVIRLHSEKVYTKHTSAFAFASSFAFSCLVVSFPSLKFLCLVSFSALSCFAIFFGLEIPLVETEKKAFIYIFATNVWQYTKCPFLVILITASKMEKEYKSILDNTTARGNRYQSGYMSWIRSEKK